MSIRGLDNSLVTSLLNEDAFLYAHLVKFERVVTTVSGKPAETGSDYSYLTDCSFNISYNDGSVDLAGGANGAQTYVANRLLKVGSINETTEAKASTLSIDISSIALNSTIAGASINITSTSANSIVTVELNTGDDWVESGFSEGDKITFTHNSNTSDANHNSSVTIQNFTNNNMTAVCNNPSYVFSNVSNNSAYTITLTTDEVAALLNDPLDATYNGYINREVFIYKAHIVPDTGAIIGEPFLIFKGIISKGKLKEDPSSRSTMTWSMSSHWGDFVRVNGRITSDSEHRAIGTNGQIDGSALHRYEYGNDYGFMHSEQAINMMATYQVQETRYKMKSSGLFGLKKKLKEYKVTVDRDVDLKLNLEAKYLPVVYGVNRIDSIPIFADTKADAPNEIYAVYALCEGEISGLLDIYIDDEPRICVDEQDGTDRSGNSDSNEGAACEGRMDRGDTMSSAAFVQKTALIDATAYASSTVSRGGMFGGALWDAMYFRYLLSVTDTLQDNSSTGVTHEKKTTFQTPIATTLNFHAGRAHQRSDDMISAIAAEGHVAGKGFKLQDSAENRKQYWTSNHRLLDTAYVAAKFTVEDGDVTIPTMDFVVRGREIEQYNYDFSYRPHPNPAYSGGLTTDVQAAKFKLGDKVDFYTTVGGSTFPMAQNVQIVDKYIYVDARETLFTKFRFPSDPHKRVNLTIGEETDFYMVKAGVASSSNDRFRFVTWDHKVDTGTLSSANILEQAVHTSSGAGKAVIANNASGAGVDVTELSTLLQSILEFDRASDNRVVIVSLVGDGISTNDEAGTRKLVQSQPEILTSGSTTTINNLGTSNLDKAGVAKIVVLNAIRLNDTASSIAGFYNSHTIRVSHEETDGTVKSQEREIVAYTGGTDRVAFVGSAASTDSSTDVIITTGTTPSQHKLTASVNNTKVINLNITTNLAPGDYITDTEAARITFPNQIPSGTRIDSISGTQVTLTKEVSILAGMFMVFTRKGGAGAVLTPSAFDFQPLIGDTYEISPIGDKKVSINPAIQLLDYLQNERFGRGLDLGKDIRLETFKQTARLCDTRSDITLSVANSTSLVLGQEWFTSTIIPTGQPQAGEYFQWQGKVKKIESIVYLGTTYKQVTFTDCIGKICYQWNDWKEFETGQAFYRKDASSPFLNKLYINSGSTGTISSSTVDGLTALSGLSIVRADNTSITAAVFISGTEEASSADHNPVVKQFKQAGGTSSFAINGYDLYDSDDVKYWRYMGWQTHDQREVTRHQTNAVIRTETPVFNNVNSMLEHFNGILRFSNGKYELDVESTAPEIGKAISSVTITNGGSGYNSLTLALFSVPNNLGVVSNVTGQAIGIPTISNGAITGVTGIPVNFGYSEGSTPTVTFIGGGGSGASGVVNTLSDPRIISQDDIIGAISVDDAGVKSSANTVSVSIPDPQIRFDNRSISFFKSDYLKEDRGIPKKKDIKTPLISNYFNARINAEQYLDQSRFSRKINFTIGPKGVLLVAGTVIKVSYTRFGWVNKLFRISNLSFREDCLVQVTAQEHSDNVYFIDGTEKLAIGAQDTRIPPTAVPVPSPPVNLVASTNLQSKVQLTWDNSVQVKGADWSTQLWMHTNSSFSNGTGAELLASFDNGEKKYTHANAAITGTTTYYYWIRHVKTVQLANGRKTTVASLFHPVNTSAGVQGQASVLQGQNAGIVYVYKLVAQGSSAPTIQSTFPTVTVTLDGGANHNKITAIPSGNGSASLSGSVGSFTIIGTNGASTGWSTNKPSITGTNNIWMSAATTNSSSGSDDIARTEWAGPIQDSGTHGETSAVVTIYRVTGSASVPALPNGSSTFTFNTGALSTTNLNGWTLAQPATNQSSARYLWKSTAAALAVTSVSGNTTDTILASEWSSPPTNIHINPIDGTDGNNGTNGTNGQNGVSVTGPDGKRSANGYIYFRTTNSNNPFASGGTGTFSFSAVSIINNLSTGLAPQAVNAGGYSNSPYVVEVGSTDYYWSARWSYTDSIAGNSTNNVTVNITAAVQHTSFTGLVTFSGGTFNLNGGAIFNTTAIDGAVITTGILRSVGTPVTTVDGSAFTSANNHTYINLQNGAIAAKNFRLQSNGNAFFQGSITANSGSIAGWTIDANKLSKTTSTGTIELNASTNQIVIKNGGVDRVIIGKLS